MHIYVKQCEIMQKIYEKGQTTNFSDFFLKLISSLILGEPGFDGVSITNNVKSCKKINDKAQKANLGLEFRLGGSRIWWNIKCQTSSSQIESVSLITCTNLIFRSIKSNFLPIMCVVTYFLHCY